MRLAKGRFTLVAALAGTVIGILNVPAPLQAQALNLSVVIPFDFHVGEKTLPAGTYIVHRQGDAVQISDSKGHSAFVLSNAVPNPAAKMENQVLFIRYGDENYLSEVRWVGYFEARGLIKSTNEIQLAKSYSGQSVLKAGMSR